MWQAANGVSVGTHPTISDRRAAKFLIVFLSWCFSLCPPRFLLYTEWCKGHLPLEAACDFSFTEGALIDYFNFSKSFPSTFTHFLPRCAAKWEKNDGIIVCAAFMFSNIKFQVIFVSTYVFVCHECMKLCNLEVRKLQLHISLTYCYLSRHLQRNVRFFSLTCNCGCARRPEFS